MMCTNKKWLLEGRELEEEQAPQGTPEQKIPLPSTLLFHTAEICFLAGVGMVIHQFPPFFKSLAHPLDLQMAYFLVPLVAIVASALAGIPPDSDDPRENQRIKLLHHNVAKSFGLACFLVFTFSQNLLLLLFCLVIALGLNRCVFPFNLTEGVWMDWLQSYHVNHWQAKYATVQRIGSVGWAAAAFLGGVLIDR